MKTRITLALSLISLMIILLSLTIFQSSSNPHGGTVKPAGNYYIEMKKLYPNFYAYLLDKNYKPINNKGISCEVRLIFYDSTSVNFPLKPFNEDGFISESSTLNFYSCRVYFKIAGKSVSANFENENPIVEKNK